MPMTIDDDKTTIEAIRRAIANTALGTVLVAISDRGVVAILIGDDRVSLVGDLARTCP